MRRTGKYYYLNLLLAFLPLVGAIMMARMGQKPRWTDWLNPFPHGIGTGGNGKVVFAMGIPNFCI
jgi:hypothetical protein